MGMNSIAVEKMDVELQYGWFVSLQVDTERRLHVVIGASDGDIAVIGSDDGDGTDGLPYGQCFTTDVIEEEHAAIYNRVWKEGARGDTK